MIIGVVGDHLTYLQPVQGLTVNRHTDKPPGIGRHEVYLLGGYCLGSNDYVAFIFSVFVIYDNDHAAVLYVVNGCFYCGKSHFIHS